MDVISEILEKTSDKSNKYKSITVEKHLEVNCDVGGLLVSDTNDLDKTSLW